MGQSGFRLWIRGCASLVLSLLGGLTALSQAAPAVAAKSAPLPAIVEKDGRFALMVDGAPYLMLGVQANNSSAWPEYLGKVWPAAEDAARQHRRAAHLLGAD